LAVWGLSRSAFVLVLHLSEMSRFSKSFVGVFVALWLLWGGGGEKTTRIMVRVEYDACTHTHHVRGKQGSRVCARTLCHSVCTHTLCVRVCVRACSNNGCVAPDAGQRTTNQSNICSPHIGVTQHAFDRCATGLRLDYLLHVVLLRAPGLPHFCARASITSLGTCLCWPGFMRAGLCGPRTNLSATPTILRCALLLCSHSRAH